MEERSKTNETVNMIGPLTTLACSSREDIRDDVVWWSYLRKGVCDAVGNKDDSE